MYHCYKCNREFEKRHSYIGHCASHYPRKPRRKKERPVKDHKCKFCGWQGSPTTIGGHTNWCLLNPNRDLLYEKVVEKNREKAKPHSEETKKRISESRLRYLENNPDKVPYLLHHSSIKSYPEQVFENALISSNIQGWKYNFQNSIYCYDFAFIDLKIDVEIDGGTHKTERVQKIDKRRDEFSEKNGWIVLRFTACEIKKDVISCISKLKDVISIRSENVP